MTGSFIIQTSDSFNFLLLSVQSTNLFLNPLPPVVPLLSVCTLSALLNSIMIETMSPTSELHYHHRNRLTVLITML